MLPSRDIKLSREVNIREASQHVGQSLDEDLVTREDQQPSSAVPKSPLGKASRILVQTESDSAEAGESQTEQGPSVPEVDDGCARRGSGEEASTSYSSSQQVRKRRRDEDGSSSGWLQEGNSNAPKSSGKESKMVVLRQVAAVLILFLVALVLHFSD